jgi:hypothetical protein
MEILMMEEKITCSACGNPFVYTEREREFLEDLKKRGKISEVVRPRKCFPCRSASRRSRAAAALPTVQALVEVETARSEVAKVAQPLPAPIQAAVPAPMPAPVPVRTTILPSPLSVPAGPSVAGSSSVPPSVPGVPDKEELVILVASDFEQLVCREEVVWRQGNRKIRIRLADIGPEAMKRAMERGLIRWWKS